MPDARSPDEYSLLCTVSAKLSCALGLLHDLDPGPPPPVEALLRDAYVLLDVVICRRPPRPMPKETS